MSFSEDLLDNSSVHLRLISCLFARPSQFSLRSHDPEILMVFFFKVVEDEEKSLQFFFFFNGSTF